MNRLKYLLFTFFIILSLSQFISAEEDTNKDIEIYEVRFFSLKPKNYIGKTRFFFKERNVLKIEIEGENFLNTKGSYTINGLKFEANWYGELKKQDMVYCYTFNLKGIKGVGVIIGFLKLKELAPNGMILHKIPFFFIGEKRRT